MKTSDLLMLGALGAGIYFLSQQKTASPSDVTAPITNIYTQGYDAGKNVAGVAEAAKQAATTTNISNKGSSGSSGVRTSGTTSPIINKIVQDVFNTNISSAAPGTGEDIAVAQNYARGLVGTKNADGGFSYKL
jgi:hypothetical protein